MKTLSRMLFQIWPLFLLLFAAGCTKPILVNDYFGIQMDPQEENYFKIASYSEKNGANYQSTPNMNPRVFAWASLAPSYIQVSVFNQSESPIPTSWLKDVFTVTLSGGKEVLMDKGNRDSYPAIKEIPARGSTVYRLVFPKYFWNARGPNSGIRNPKANWVENKSTYLHKEDISRIDVKLGGQVEIILKPVPVKKK